MLEQQNMLKEEQKKKANHILFNPRLKLYELSIFE